MKKLLMTAVIALAVLALAPAAKADQVTLNLANIAVTGPFGTVTYVLNGSNIDVTVTMNAGFTIKGGDGNAFGFNVVGSTTGLAVTNLMGNLAAITSDPLNLGPNIDGFGIFEFALAKLGGAGGANLNVLSFTVSRTGGFSSASNLFELSSGGGSGIGHFVVHLVSTASGNTGFAVDAPGTQVPEPGTMVLLGAGLLGLAALRRRLL